MKGRNLKWINSWKGEYWRITEGIGFCNFLKNIPWFYFNIFNRKKKEGIFSLTCISFGFGFSFTLWFNNYKPSPLGDIWAKEEKQAVKSLINTINKDLLAEGK